MFQGSLFLPDGRTPTKPSESGRHWNPATALWACCRYRSVIRHLRSCTAEKGEKDTLLCPNDSKSLRLAWQPESTSAVFVLLLYWPNLGGCRQARLEHVIPAWCEVATMWLCSPAYAAWSNMFVTSTRNSRWVVDSCNYPKQSQRSDSARELVDWGSVKVMKGLMIFVTLWSCCLCWNFEVKSSDIALKTLENASQAMNIGHNLAGQWDVPMFIRCNNHTLHEAQSQWGTGKSSTFHVEMAKNEDWSDWILKCVWRLKKVLPWHNLDRFSPARWMCQGRQGGSQSLCDVLWSGILGWFYPWVSLGDLKHTSLLLR